MTTAWSGIEGAKPDVQVGEGNVEALKYGKLWEMEEYRKVAPGESLAQVFLAQARPRRGAEVIDFGCGTGRGALMLAILGGLKVTMVDFVRNCLDLEIREALTTQTHALRFLKHDLEAPLPVAAEYGFCTDTMEHIPPEKVGAVLNNVLRAAQHVFFSISTVEDRCGSLIGEPLHLSVHPYSWWLREFAARDCVIHWSQEAEGTALFYVTAWQSGGTIVEKGKINTEDEILREHVKHNIAQGWQQAMPHATNDLEVMILGGGPSLNEFTERIKWQRSEGVKLITLNGTYNWALERGLTPSATLVVDAREFNARFVRPVVDDCKYLICSQVHPAVFEGLPKDRTYIWHTCAELVGDVLKEHYGEEPVWPVPGGSTVLLRAIPLLRMLGYRRFHLYGCDSSLHVNDPENLTDIARQRQRDGKRTATIPKPGIEYEHHAYEQVENDPGVAVAVTVNPGGRVFWCHPWMVSQAQEFCYLIRALGDEIELEIYGDGLLAHILKTGAALEPTGEEIKT